MIVRPRLGQLTLILTENCYQYCQSCHLHGEELTSSKASWMKMYWSSVWTM